jgi:hypothetical protein
MPLTLDELDGTYDVRSESLEAGAAHTVDGDGTTDIRNGLTYRKDKNGLIWESAFSLLDDGKKVQMESTVDPSHTTGTVYIRDAAGNPTTGMLTFRTILDVSREGGRLSLSGIIEHGIEKTRLTLTKIP